MRWLCVYYIYGIYVCACVSVLVRGCCTGRGSRNASFSTCGNFFNRELKQKNKNKCILASKIVPSCCVSYRSGSDTFRGRRGESYFFEENMVILLFFTTVFKVPCVWLEGLVKAHKFFSLLVFFRFFLWWSMKCAGLFMMISLFELNE